MAYSFSQMTDDQLAAVVDDLHNNPLTRVTTPYDQQVAVTQELARRRARMREEPSQAAGNDAAAAPIVPDADVGPKDPRTQYRADLITAGWSPEQADRFTEQEAGMPHPFAFGVNPESERAAAGRAAQRDARHSANEAYWKDVYGHNDEPPMSTSFEMRDNGSAYGAMPDFGDGTAMVDGVEVPAFDLGDGKQRYRLGDLKRAQEAAADAKYAEMVSKSAQEDLAKYGDKQMVRYTYGPDGQVTGTEYVAPSTLTPQEAKQQANLIARRGMEGRQQRQNAALSNRPGLRALEAREAQRRNLYSDMARLAGGSSRLNGGNMDMFQALAMLEGVDPSKMDAQQQAMMQMMPMDPRRAAVESQNMTNAGDVIKRYMTSGAAAGLMGDPGSKDAERRAGQVQVQNAESQQAAAIAADAEAIVGDYAWDQSYFNLFPRLLGLGNTPLNPAQFTIAEEEKAIRRLMAKYPHLTYEQAMAHVAAAAANTTRQRDMAEPPAAPE